MLVIFLRSRLGTEFAKGQNKRTAEVGYFPISQGIYHRLPLLNDCFGEKIFLNLSYNI